MKTLPIGQGRALDAGMQRFCKVCGKPFESLCSLYAEVSQMVVWSLLAQAKFNIRRAKHYLLCKYEP